tara:strand:- start:1538 stop:2512 length:975 start_codon:yes stop_codon:yes gene_type:complete
MSNNIETTKRAFFEELDHNKSIEELLRFKGAYLGKQGKISSLLAQIKEIKPEERGKYGQAVNQLKKEATAAFQKKKEQLETGKKNAAQVDLSMPGTGHPSGNLHPLTQTTEQVITIFKKLGFSVESGPEIESDFYNFEALNMPKHHPARDMQDTFFIDSNHVLRTHTSGIQIRTMEKQKPPIRIIAPGKVFRVDRDTTHSPVFHQIEGLMVDTDVNFKHLKFMLRTFIQELFGSDREVRFRPSFFPFTEPSAEMDVMSEQGQWMEILGCGMVDPNVFEAVGIDSDIYTGWAFGIGIERITMLKYGMTDIRPFFENDIRFLEQFI